MQKNNLSDTFAQLKAARQGTKRTDQYTSTLTNAPQRKI
jgi:hypothetical protein